MHCRTYKNVNDNKVQSFHIAQKNNIKFDKKEIKTYMLLYPETARKHTNIKLKIYILSVYFVVLAFVCFF